MKRVLALLVALTAAAFGQAASDNIIVVGNVAQPVQWVHQVDIKTALLKAGPNGTVIIPANYIGTDCAPISSCTPGTTLVIDFRGGLFQTVPAISGGSGVTTVSVTPANGVTGSVANPTTTPAITLTLGAVTPSSIVDTGIAVAPNTSPICPNGTGGAFSITGCASGGAPAFSAVTAGTNTAALVEGAGGTFTPATAGQVAGDTSWYPYAAADNLPAVPTLAANATGGGLAAGNSAFIRVTYVGLASVIPSPEALIQMNATTGCVSSCSVTVTMPSTCVSGSLPAGVTGCTVWSSPAINGEKQQTAAAACVNITTTTCIIGTLGTGGLLTAAMSATSGVNPPGFISTAQPDLIIPSLFIQKTNGYYALGGVDNSALNLIACCTTSVAATPPSKAGTNGGTFTFTDRVFFNDDVNPPPISNTLISIKHESGATTSTLTNPGSGIDDRAFTLRIDNDLTSKPNYEQYLGGYIETYVDNAATTVAGVSQGSPWGENGAAGWRATAIDQRTTQTNPVPFTGSSGFAGNFASATVNCPGQTVCFAGVEGGAAELANSTNGGGFAWAGGWFGANGVAGNTNGIGYGVQIDPPAVRFATRNILLSLGDVGANVADWNIVSRTNNPSTSAANYFGGMMWEPGLVADNGTYPITGSISVTGGITTTQMVAPTLTGISNFGTAGAITVIYKVTSVDSNGNETTSSAQSQTNTANADLTAVHGNTVNMGTSLGVSSYNIYRTSSGGATCNGGACTNGKIGNVVVAQTSFLRANATSFSDTGQAGDGNTAVAQGNTTGGIKPFNYQTNTNCAVNSASPAACGSAAAGAVVVPTTTTTYTVNTSAVTTHSRIMLTPMSFAGDLPSAPTCVTPAVTAEASVSAISAGASFTMALPSTTGQSCWQYWIVN